MRKCKAKNRVSVALLIENPPHSHSTTEDPTYGIADNKLVITVAPQKDICPHGNTYPKNAVAIRINRIMIPDIHVFISLNDLINIPRLMWIKIKIKKNLAVFI
jgi:predicted P-loop ATPase/GTPase